MKIKSLASGSKGNCYYVTDGTSSLLIEAGLPFNQIQQALDYKLTSLDGCLISHEHGDHAKAVRQLLKAGVTVATSFGTAEALELKHHRLIQVEHQTEIKLNDWLVLSFNVEHETAAQPLGFLIYNQVSGKKLLYATDSCYLKYKFPKLTHIMIEVNHSRLLLDQNLTRGVLNQELRNQIAKNHMSLEVVLDFLKANDLSNVEEIILLHLSETNSDAEHFKKTVQAVTGKVVKIA